MKERKTREEKKGKSLAGTMDSTFGFVRKSLSTGREFQREL